MELIKKSLPTTIIYGCLLNLENEILNKCSDMRTVWKRVAGFACANFALPGLIFGCRLLPKSLFGRLIPHLPSENQILALSYATQAIAISAFPTDSI